MSHLGICAGSSQVQFLQQMLRFELNPGTSRLGLVAADRNDWITPASHDLPRGSGAPPVPRYSRENKAMVQALAKQMESVRSSSSLFSEHEHRQALRRRASTPGASSTRSSLNSAPWNGVKSTSQRARAHITRRVEASHGACSCCS